MEFDPVGSAESIPDMIKNDTLIEVLDQDQLSECLKNITLNVDDSLYILNNVQPKYNVSDRFKAVRHIFTDFGEGDKFESKKFVEFIRVLGRCLHIDIHDSIAAIIESTFSKNEQLKIKSDKYDSLVSNPADQSGLLNEIFNQWIKNERDSFSKQKDEIQAELQMKNIKLAALEVKINELNQENSELMKQLDDKRGELAEKDQIIQNFQKIVKGLKKVKEKLETKVESLLNDNKKLHEIIDRQQSSSTRDLARGTSSERYGYSLNSEHSECHPNYRTAGSSSIKSTRDLTKRIFSTSSARDLTKRTSSTSSTRDLTRGTSSAISPRNLTSRTSSANSTRDLTSPFHSLSYGYSLRETSSTNSTRDLTREQPSSTSTSGQQD